MSRDQVLGMADHAWGPLAALMSHLTSARRQVMGVLASDTTVPSAKAAATEGKNHPGRTRARQRLQIATSAIRMPNTMLPT